MTDSVEVEQEKNAPIKFALIPNLKDEKRVNINMEDKAKLPVSTESQKMLNKRSLNKSSILEKKNFIRLRSSHKMKLKRLNIEDNI